jgi:hypothetical protein
MKSYKLVHTNTHAFKEQQTQCLTKVLIYPNRYLTKCKIPDHQKWDVTNCLAIIIINYTPDIKPFSGTVAGERRRIISLVNWAPSKRHHLPWTMGP